MRGVVKFGIIASIIVCVSMMWINAYVRVSIARRIIDKIDCPKIKNVDCIIILGAGVWENRPSPMLRDRLLVGIDVYRYGDINKIIMSGDHGRKGYDEVNVMKEFAISENIPSEDIFMDHAGFSTYDSIYRAKEIFCAKRVIIVTQSYHLYRAVYIANKLGLDAYGIGADVRQYRGQFVRGLREFLARNKDFAKCIVRSKPKYLGETIPVSGNGDLTNDVHTKK